MGKRWITGQEIIDEFTLQPFELLSAMAATLAGTTTTGEEVGQAAYIMHYSYVYPIDRQHVAYSKSRTSPIFAHMRLNEIDKVKRLRNGDSEHCEMLFFDPSDTTFDEIFGLYYALTPEKYKTETGVDRELFCRDIPTFVFNEDEYAAIRKLIKEGGLASADDAPASAAGGQDVPGVAHKNETKPALSKKDQDRQDALAAAAGYWEANPELRPKQVAEAILENRRVEWRCQAPEQKTLRDWLAPHAPPSAKKTGRPRGIPKE